MPSLPTDPRGTDAAITSSGFVSLGDASSYRGSVNTGDGDTALIFVSDRQLELRRVVWCTSTPLFGWCLRYFISYLRSSSSIPITRSLQLTAINGTDRQSNECLITLSLTFFTQRNFVADFLQAKCNFNCKTAVLCLGLRGNVRCSS